MSPTGGPSVRRAGRSGLLAFAHLGLLCGALLGALSVPNDSSAEAGRDQAELASPRDTELESSTAPTRLELESLARSLSHPDRATRRLAFEALSTLGHDALPAIAARLTGIAQSNYDREGVLAAWSAFRKVQGVDSPEAPVDLAKGALSTLDAARPPATALGAELIALLRALEAQKSPEASELIVTKLVALDGKLFRYEAPRIRERLSVLLIPAFIRHQNHLKPWVRSFCQEGLSALSMTSPGRAVQQDDVILLAAILKAYGDTLNFEAMPVVVSYITDERLEVQSAARKAVERFGRNAIWQIRERFLNATGKEPDPNWSHQRILSELYRLHAEPKQQAFERELHRAQAAFDSADYSRANSALEAALRASPALEDHKRTAPLFFALGEKAIEGRDLTRALTAFRRALRLDPEGPEQSRLRARIAYLEGELRLAQGVLDLTRFERARELDPAFAPAESAYDELSGERAARDERKRHWMGLLAALLMAGAGFTLLRRGQATQAGTRDEGADVLAHAVPVSDAGQPGASELCAPVSQD